MIRNVVVIRNINVITGYGVGDSQKIKHNQINTRAGKSSSGWPFKLEQTAMMV